MMRHKYFRRGMGRVAVFIALLAMLLRLGSAAALPPPPVPALDTLLAGEICHAPGTDRPADPAGQPGHGHACELCPACVTFAPVLAADVPAATPAPAPGTIRYLLPPPGAAPPAADLAFFQPRGPPRLA